MFYLSQNIHLLSFLYPKICIHCKKAVYQKEKILCISCAQKFNKLIHTHQDHVEFYHTFSSIHFIFFTYFKKNEPIHSLLHNFKYKGNIYIGKYLGGKMAELIQPLNITADYILPVPMHPIKEIKRSFNQCEILSREISDITQIPIIPKGAIIKTFLGESQTKKSKMKRLKEKENSFLLIKPEYFEGKNIMIIDDVFSTGATMYALLDAIQSIKNIRITIFVLAYNKMSL